MQLARNNHTLSGRTCSFNQNPESVCSLVGYLAETVNHIAGQADKLDACYDVVFYKSPTLHGQDDESGKAVICRITVAVQFQVGVGLTDQSTTSSSTGASQRPTNATLDLLVSGVRGLAKDRIPPSRRHCAWPDLSALLGS